MPAPKPYTTSLQPSSSSICSLAKPTLTRCISGDAPRTGRTQFYMGLMDARVHRSRKKVKFMIAGLTLALEGVVPVAILQAPQLDAGDAERPALANRRSAAPGARAGAAQAAGTRYAFRFTFTPP